MRRTPKPPTPDRREPWQIEQGKACGCGGSDDMCACQNENPWPRPVTHWQPLDTAPRDGRPFLVWRPPVPPRGHPPHQVYVGWMGTARYEPDGPGIRLRYENPFTAGGEPTRWHPLPDPPEDQV